MSGGLPLVCCGLETANQVHGAKTAEASAAVDSEAAFVAVDPEVVNDHHLEARACQLQQQHGHLDIIMRNLQAQVSKCIQVMNEALGPDNVPFEQGSRAEEAAYATERTMAALDRRVLG